MSSTSSQDLVFSDTDLVNHYMNFFIFLSKVFVKALLQLATLQFIGCVLVYCLFTHALFMTEAD